MTRGGAERQLLHLAQSLHHRSWPQAVVCFNPEGGWADRWEPMGIPFFEISRTPLKPWRLWQLSQILRRERPGILHTWSVFLTPYVRLAWGKGDAGTVFGVRSNLAFDTHTGKPVDRIPFIRSLVRADCIVSNSQASLDSLRQRGIRLPRTAVIRNIVEPNSRAADAAQSNTLPCIVSVGRLDSLKGHACLLHAAKLLANQQKSFELVLVGEGPERSSLETLTSELELRHCVRFLGEIDHVPDLMATAHILAHPSQHEGLSNTILEGMAAGLAVVSTIECASEIVEDGRTGLLVPANQPNALADALRRLLDNPPLRGSLGAAAHQQVKHCCNVDVITSEYERVYRSLLTALPEQ